MVRMTGVDDGMGRGGGRAGDSDIIRIVLLFDGLLYLIPNTFHFIYTPR